jgi:hypothetical protein
MSEITITHAQASLIERIKAHIAKGDKAAEKAGQHYVAAGQYLNELKANHTGNWEEWEVLLKSKVGIGKSRASELMQIADGRKSVEQVRANTNQRKLDHRKPLRSGTENQEPGNGDRPKPKPARSQDQTEVEAAQAHAAEIEASREHDREELHEAKRKIIALESEIADLKREDADLRAQLDAAKAKPIDTAAKKRGRPKGSKNKPKSPVVLTTVNVATPRPDLGNDPGPFPETLRRDRVHI